MEITTDVILKGSNWRKALDLFSPFFPQTLQPNYSIFAISIGRAEAAAGPPPSTQQRGATSGNREAP